MNIVGLLQESFAKLRSNPMVLVPILAVTVLIGILSLVMVGSIVPQIGPVHSQAEISPDEAIGFAGMAFGRIMTVLVVGSIVGLIAHGMTVMMADDALQGRTVQLSTAWNRTRERLIPLVVTAVVVGLVTSIGFALLVLPGVVIAFLLMFSFVALMVHELPPMSALARSFRVVKSHFAATFVFFLIMIALGVLIVLVNLVIGMIPVLGALISLVVASAYASFLSVFVVAVYRGLTDEGGSPPRPEV
ncbi:MAG: hypothetical protein ACLFSV_00625 [Alkalispirochaeta sp.]